MELHGVVNDYRTKKICIAARIAGIELTVSEDRLEEVCAACAPAKSPVLETPEGFIFQSNAILRYIAGLARPAKLYGEGIMDKARVDQWLDFTWNEVEVAGSILLQKETLQKSVGNYKASEENAKKDITKALTILNEHFQERTYIVGEGITIADVSFVSVLAELQAKGVCLNVFENVLRWFTTCSKNPEFSGLDKLGKNQTQNKSLQRATALDSSAVIGKQLFHRKRIRVKELLDAGISSVGKNVVVKGWAKTLREQGAGSFLFLELNDGSCINGVQVVMNKGECAGFEDVLASGGAGASFGITGVVVKSPAKGQIVEVKAAIATVYGKVMDKATYPMSKKRHTLEHLRANMHLRPRANIHGAAMRVRNALAFVVHKFFNERGFLYIQTPLITGSDCEGAGEMFSVTTLLAKHPKGDLPKTRSGEIDYSQDFFGKPAYLTVSGQLNLETHCCALSDVYSFGPTFRAENSNTSRHLAEFWMIEPEVAFANLKDNMDLAEDFLKCCVEHVLEHCASDLEFFDSIVEKGLLKRLRQVVTERFERVTYTEAVALLNQQNHLKKGKFQVKPRWGDDLGSEHERYLTEKLFKKPVTLYNYPKDIKAFYMRLNDDNKTVAAVDVLVPTIGELIGGSQREERLDVLRDRIVEATGHNPDDYGWYNDLRKYGSVEHSGFGLGFERLVRFVTGIENIRDVIPFPRWPGNVSF